MKIKKPQKKTTTQEQRNLKIIINNYINTLDKGWMGKYGCTRTVLN
jgi:hypothetical protein